MTKTFEKRWCERGQEEPAAHVEHAAEQRGHGQAGQERRHPPGQRRGERELVGVGREALGDQVHEGLGEEEERQRDDAEDEQQHAEQGVGELPCGAGAVGLVLLGEQGHEDVGQRALGQQLPEQVRDAHGRQVGVRGHASAEDGGEHHVPHQAADPAEGAGQSGGGRTAADPRWRSRWRGSWRGGGAWRGRRAGGGRADGALGARVTVARASSAWDGRPAANPRSAAGGRGTCNSRRCGASLAHKRCRLQGRWHRHRMSPRRDPCRMRGDRATSALACHQPQVVSLPERRPCSRRRPERASHLRLTARRRAPFSGRPAGVHHAQPEPIHPLPAPGTHRRRPTHWHRVGRPRALQPQQARAPRRVV